MTIEQIPESNFIFSKPKKYLQPPIQASSPIITTILSKSSTNITKNNHSRPNYSLKNEKHELNEENENIDKLQKDPLKPNEIQDSNDDIFQMLFKVRSSHTCMNSSLLFSGTCTSAALLGMTYIHRRERSIMRWVQNLIPTLSFSFVLPFCIFWVACTQLNKKNIKNARYEI